MPTLVTKSRFKNFQFFEVLDKKGQGYLVTASIVQMVYSCDKLHSGLN